MLTMLAETSGVPAADAAQITTSDALARALERHEVFREQEPAQGFFGFVRSLFDGSESLNARVHHAVGGADIVDVVSAVGETVEETLRDLRRELDDLAQRPEFFVLRDLPVSTVRMLMHERPIDIEPLVAACVMNDKLARRSRVRGGRERSSPGRTSTGGPRPRLCRGPAWRCVRLPSSTCRSRRSVVADRQSSGRHQRGAPARQLQAAAGVACERRQRPSAARWWLGGRYQLQHLPARRSLQRHRQRHPARTRRERPHVPHAVVVHRRPWLARPLRRDGTHAARSRAPPRRTPEAVRGLGRRKLGHDAVPCDSRSEISHGHADETPKVQAADGRSVETPAVVTGSQRETLEFWRARTPSSCSSVQPEWSPEPATRWVEAGQNDEEMKRRSADADERPPRAQDSACDFAYTGSGLPSGYSQDSCSQARSGR